MISNDISYARISNRKTPCMHIIIIYFYKFIVPSSIHKIFKRRDNNNNNNNNNNNKDVYRTYYKRP